jgi:hypothetical protein
MAACPITLLRADMDSGNMTFKEKVEQLKKAVRDELMEVGDHKAPGVQGGDIAPKELVIPEPEEYPDIEIQPVKMYKHVFDAIADQVQKGDWKPERIAKTDNLGKTQKHPSTKVPYEAKPTYREYVKNPENQSAHMQHLRDDKAAVSPAPPPELHASGAFKSEHPIEAFANGFSKSNWRPTMEKATIEGEIPARTPYKPPALNPPLPEPPSKKKS